MSYKTHLSHINVYPIKSTRGIALSNAWIDALGLSFDRRFVLSDDNYQFITARTEAKLCLIQASLTATGLILTAPDMPNLIIDYQQLTNCYQTVRVWGDKVNAQVGNASHHLWFSQFLKRPCQLLYFGELSQRSISANSSRSNQLAFADGYPLLLTSRASLDDLNARCPSTITMEQFRANIVVDNCNAFAEDTWSHIRIGEVEFEVMKPCSRCIFTTIDPNSAEKHTNQEPLTTLKTYREAAAGKLQGELLFGQNLNPLNQGQIKLGDTVTVLSTKSAPKLVSRKNIHPNPESGIIKSTDNKSKKIKISFNSWDKTFMGDTTTTILEQAEAAGLTLPYSCRAGICGSCKVRLIEGEVEQRTNRGLSDEEIEQGYILICSCTANTDITLSD